MDISRIRHYVKDLQNCLKKSTFSRSELSLRITKHQSGTSFQPLDSFFEWLDYISALGELDCENTESLVKFLRHSQRAKHDYADLLNAAFSTNAGHLEKWVLIILKLGRYGIASRAFFQIVMELPALFDPMNVESVPVRGKTPIYTRELNLVRVLRRLVGSKEEECLRRLQHIWKGKGDPQNYFLHQCPTHLTVHAELQLVGFYDENPERIPSFRFIGVSKKSCYLCDRFLALHPLSFTTSACHQKLYSTWATPSTRNNKSYDLYKSIATKLIGIMEVCIKEELDRRPNFPHKLVPPDSSAGVSLSGITESGTVPVASGALLESRAGRRALLRHDASASIQGCHSEHTAEHTEVESLCISSRTPYSIGQAETSNFEYEDLSFSRSGFASTAHTFTRDFMGMVLHIERAEDFLKQETVRIAEILDASTQQPSWEVLMELLKSKGVYRIGFCVERDLLVIENKLSAGNQQQLSACIQYLCNAEKLNGHGLVYQRETAEDFAHRSVLHGGDVTPPRMTRQSNWGKLGRLLARYKTAWGRNKRSLAQ